VHGCVGVSVLRERRWLADR